MTKRFYDVIVLGAGLGPLLTAALLAKRGYRLLVLGCGDQPDTYEEAGLRLPRWPSYFGVAGRPIVRRVLSELGVAQILGRKIRPLEPRYQVVLPRTRIDVTADRERYREEIAREFGDAAGSIAAFYDRLGRLAGQLDAFLRDDLVLPPDGFFERRRFQRASIQNPFGPYGDSADVFGDLPADHPFRLCVSAQVRFATYADPDVVTPMQIARLHESWLADGSLPEGLPGGLRAFLCDRISLHAGELALDTGVSEIAVRRGRVIGVRRAGEEEVTGAEYVVAGVEMARLAPLFPDRDLPASFAGYSAACRPKYRLFTWNTVVRRDVIPVGMARHVFFVPDPPYPPIEDNHLFIEVVPLDDERAVVCAQAFALTERMDADSAYLVNLAERIQERLRWLFPFLDRHVLLRSSPWILPAELRADPARRIALMEREARAPDRMPPVPHVPDETTLGLTCLTHRVGCRNLFLTGREVIPGLGEEGTLLSAWTVARIITEKNPRQARLKREVGPRFDLP